MGSSPTRPTPTVQAFAGYLAAMRRRSHLHLENGAALTRLGKQAPATPAGMQTELLPAEVVDSILRVADRIASEHVHDEMDELHTSRETAGTDTNREN